MEILIQVLMVVGQMVEMVIFHIVVEVLVEEDLLTFIIHQEQDHILT